MTNRELLEDMIGPRTWNVKAAISFIVRRSVSNTDYRHWPKIGVPCDEQSLTTQYFVAQTHIIKDGHWLKRRADFHQYQGLQNYGEVIEYITELLSSTDPTADQLIDQFVERLHLEVYRPTVPGPAININPISCLLHISEAM